jgi:hypothetical protein
VETDERVARRWNQRRETREELERGHDAKLVAMIAKFFDSISELAVR